jgi:hypothetical protein
MIDSSYLFSEHGQRQAPVADQALDQAILVPSEVYNLGLE